MENKFLHKATVIWSNVCRFLLAVVFLFSGFVKANDPLGTVYKVQDYLEAWGLQSLSAGYVPYLAAMLCALFEFILGIYLFFGIRRRVAPLLALLMMAFMTPLTLWLAIANPISDCGCFGDAVVLTNWETFFKNIVLLIAAISVFKWRRHIFNLVTTKVDWLISLYSILFIIFFMLFCLRYLPVFDFRPYHVGADIIKGMTIPEGEKPTEYETIFIYSKDGKEQEFTIDNFPTDSTWTFVDSKTRVKEKGYDPPIHDFSITSLETGEDLTDDILHSDQYTFLLVAPWLKQADDSGMDLINEVYDYSVEHGYRFLCLTASSEQDIIDWQENTGAEYPFALMDEITLKTMIRSNPGLMLIRNGVILNKWNDADLPDEYALTGKLETLELGKLKKVTDSYTIGYVFLWFAIPLLFVLGMDILVVKRREKKSEALRRRNAELLKAVKLSTQEETPSDEGSDGSETKSDSDKSS